MTTPAFAVEESGEDFEEDDLQDLFIDDQADETADIEAAQLLQGLRSRDRVLADSDASTPQPAAAAPLLRKRWRPQGSNSKPESPVEWVRRKSV